MEGNVYLPKGEIKDLFCNNYGGGVRKGLVLFLNIDRCRRGGRCRDASQRTSGDTQDGGNRVEIGRCARRSVDDGDIEAGGASRIKGVGIE